MPIRSRNSRPLSAGSVPSTETVPELRRAVTLEDLDGGRLAGTVVAEQAVHLAFGDLERDPGHGIGRSVALAQVADLDHRHRQPLP